MRILLTGLLLSLFLMSAAQDLKPYEGLWIGTYKIAGENKQKTVYQFHVYFTVKDQSVIASYSFRNNKNELLFSLPEVNIKMDAELEYNQLDNSIQEKNLSMIGESCQGFHRFRFLTDNYLKIYGLFKAKGKKDCPDIVIELNKFLGNALLTNGYPYNPDAIKIDASELDNFKEGRAVIRKDDQFAIIDKTGKLIVPWGKYKFNERGTYTIDKWRCGYKNGMCVVRDPETELYGFIDYSGKLVVPCTLSAAGPYAADGFGWGKQKNENNTYSYFYYDEKGNRFPLKYTPYDDNNMEVNYAYMVREGNGYTSVYHKTGRLILKTRKNIIGPYSDGLIKVDTSFELAGRKTGFIDTTGRLVIPWRKERIDGNFRNGYVMFTEASQESLIYGFLNKKNEVKIKIPKSSVIQKARMLSDFNPILEANPQSPKFAWVEINDDLSILYEDGRIVNFRDMVNIEMAKWRTVKPEREIRVFPTTDYIGGHRNDKNVSRLFQIEAYYSYEEPTEFVSGGVGGGVRIIRTKKVPASGIGLMDLDARIIADPVFREIGLFDEYSGLLKASFYDSKKGVTVEGYINEQGHFMIVKSNN